MCAQGSRIGFETPVYANEFRHVAVSLRRSLMVRTLPYVALYRVLRISQPQCDLRLLKGCLEARCILRSWSWPHGNNEALYRALQKDAQVGPFQGLCKAI